MTFAEAVRTVLVEKYANFQGRAARAEFWWFFVLLVIVEAVSQGILVGSDVRFGEAASTLIGLATFIPTLAVGCRRLHDTGRSGWWQLLHLLPAIGTFALLIFWALPGDSSANRFGPPPIA